MLTRVTTPLSHFKTEAFFKWRLRVGEREANAICKRAEKVGNRLDEIIKSGDYVATKKDSDAVKRGIAGFNKWRERYQVGTIIKLDRIEDLSIGLTGEPDLYWVEKRQLIDLKATNYIWPSHFFQLGGYKRLGVDADSAAILQLIEAESDFEYLTNEKLGISMAQLVDAYESAYKHYQYHTWIENRIKGEA